MTTPQVKTVDIVEVIKLLKEGYTRWTNEEVMPGKSIQTKFGLKFAECKQLFAVQKLKGIKTKIPTLMIIDSSDPSFSSAVSDTTEEVAPTANAVEEILSAATAVRTQAAPAAEVEAVFAVSADPFDS